MAKFLSDEISLLRMAINEVLTHATAPMSSPDIHDAEQVRSLGFDPGRVSGELSIMYNLKKKPFPISRVPHTGPGNSKWDYFNPKVVKLAYKEAPPVNDVKPEVLKTEDFKFDPVPFADEVAPPPTHVPVPAGVKCITLTVGGVSIKIELQ